MKFKELTFKDQHTERIYKDYISRVKNSVKSLNSDNQNETLLEINSHIYEALQAPAENENTDLLNVLQTIVSQSFTRYKKCIHIHMYNCPLHFICILSKQN